MNKNKSSLNHYTETWAKKAPRRKAGVVGFGLLLELLVILPEFIIALPMMIMLYCSMADGYGVAIGDTSTLPAWFNGMMIKVSLITILVVCLFQLLILMTIIKAWKRTKKNNSAVAENQNTTAEDAANS